jgi:hypothetical protein
MSNEDIVDYLNKLDRDSKAIKKEIIRICWFMRGGINLDQAWLLSYQERELIAEQIKQNLETTKQSKLPFF